MTSYYNQEKPDRAPERDIEAIRNKFRNLKNVKKPTGDPTCPPLVVRAKRINYDIEAGVGVIDLDDVGKTRESDPDSESGSSDCFVSDSEEVSSGRMVSANSSPVQRRMHLSGIIPETAVPFVVDDSFAPFSITHNIQDERVQQYVLASSEEEGDIADSSAAVGNEGEKMSKVPHRLGPDSQKLGKIMENLLDKKRGTEKLKKL